MASETPSQSAPDERTQFAVLLFTDICDSTALKAQHGALKYKKVAELHNRLFESLAAEEELTLIKNTGDGYFARSTSVAAVVRFALRFQHGMRTMAWPGFPITTRVGIHAGEVADITTLGQADVLAPAADLVARVMGLAVGGQILLTRGPFDEARHFVRAHPHVGNGEVPVLAWLAHGPYLFKGCEEAVEVFEVGAAQGAPLTAPPDGEKAKRSIRPGEEETLGWRPASGLEVPGRAGWLLVDKIGEGGFGEVWLAVQATTKQKRVFKFCFDEERLRSFKRELTFFRLLRDALGERPDIARLYDVKLDEPPFFLESEYAQRGNLVEWCGMQVGVGAVPMARRLEIMAQIAEAVAAAHSVGILHKDLKPQNVLMQVRRNGEDGPQLTDFGIGALADKAALAEHAITAAGFTVNTLVSRGSSMTRLYAPPEQLTGRAFTVQGDVYALGVMLWQFVIGDFTRALAPGWEREVKDEFLREDLAECLDGDPTRRLATASELAHRLRTLEQRRTEKEAEHRRAAFNAKRKRNARIALAAGAVAAVIAAVFGAGLLRERELRKRADEAERLANTEKNRAVQAEAAAKSQLAEAARSDRVVAEVDLQAWRDREAFAHLARACEYDPAGSALAAEKAVAALNRWNNPHPTAIMQARPEKIRGANSHEIWWSAQFSPDDTRIVTYFGKTAQVWDSANGNLLMSLTAHEGNLTGAEFSYDGTRIVTASNDKSARVWDAVTGKTLAVLTSHTDDVTGAHFSADGTRIVTTSANKTARVWDAATGKAVSVLTGHAGNVSGAEFSPDGTRIVTGSEDKTARVWDSVNGRELAVLAGHKDFLSAHFSPDGTRIITPSGDGTARIWDAARGKLLTTLSIVHGWVLDAQFSADGKQIVTAEGEKVGTVWDAASGRKLATLTGHKGDVFRAQFSPNGKTIVTASLDDTARVWDAETGKELATLAGHGGWVLGAQFSHDGKRIVTASQDGTARVWSLPRLPAPPSLVGHGGAITNAQFSPDGKRIVTASSDNTARIWDVASRKVEVRLIGHADEVTSAQFNFDGTRIVTGSKDKTVRVWDAVSGAVLTTIEEVGHDVTHAQFSPDGTRIVTTSDEMTARIWDAATGKMLLTLTGHEKDVHRAQFSPDGTRIVTASEDATARIWDAATGKMLLTLAGHERPVHDAQFSPDGTRVVTASIDRTARAWDATTGKELATYFDSTFSQQLHRVHLSSDGRRMTTNAWGSNAGMWDVASGQLLATFGTGKGVVDSASRASNVQDARFSPDGAWIVTSSGEWKARIWSILPPGSGLAPEWFPDFLRYMAQMRIAPTGGMETIQADEWLALREKLRAVLKSKPVDQYDAYLKILRRWVKVE